MPQKKGESVKENKPFLPTTVVRYEIPETREGYPWMELYGALVAGVTFLCSGVVQSYTSGAIYSIQTDVTANIHLTKSSISWIASAPPLAALVGNLAAGPMMERFGRKRTITFLSIPFIVGWLLIGFAVDVAMILIGRFVTGLAFGMSRTCAPVYVGETARAKHRGKLGYLPPIMSAVGVFLGCWLGTYMNWKQLAIAMAFIPAATLLFSLYLPETPHWLISQNQEDQAFLALKKLRGRHGTETDTDLRLYKEIQEIREAIEQSTNSITTPEYDHTKHEKQGLFQLLKQPSICRPTVLVFLLMIVQQFSGVSAIIFYMNMILNHGEASNLQDTTATPANSSQILPPPPPPNHQDLRPTVVGLVHILAFFITLPMVDCLGRKILLKVSGLFMTVFNVVLAYYFYAYVGSLSDSSQGEEKFPHGPTGPHLRHLRDTDLSVHRANGINNLTASPADVAVALTDGIELSLIHFWVPLLAMCGYMASFSLGSSIPYILMSEMITLNVRSYLSSTAMLLSGIASFLVVHLFPHLMYGVNPVFTFALFAVFSLSNTVIGYIIPETKGKSLAEIENLFRGPKEFTGKHMDTVDDLSIVDVAAELADELDRYKF